MFQQVYQHSYKAKLSSFDYFRTENQVTLFSNLMCDFQI